jgi:hypothetical protein
LESLLKSLIAGAAVNSDWLQIQTNFATNTYVTAISPARGTSDRALCDVRVSRVTFSTGGDNEHQRRQLQGH